MAICDGKPGVEIGKRMTIEKLVLDSRVRVKVQFLNGMDTIKKWTLRMDIPRKGKCSAVFESKFVSYERQNYKIFRMT